MLGLIVLLPVAVMAAETPLMSHRRGKIRH